MPRVTFILPDGQRREITAATGENLMVIARKSGLDVEGACDGVMACSTCHMIVEKEWYGKLPPASDDENDMLDLAPGLTRTSRLGCQIKLTEQMNGLTVRLPRGTRNLLG